MRCETCKDLSNKDWACRGLRAIQIEKSAALGCMGCSIIVKGFRTLVSDSWENAIEGTEVGGDRWPLRLHLLGSSVDGSKTIEFFIPQRPLESPVHGVAWPGLGFGNILPPSTGSETSLRRLRTWLTERLHRHPNCGTDRGNGLPRRVIDIGNASNPPSFARLHESQGEDEAYICLGYRWPETPTAQLLGSNIEQYRKSIPFDTLPPTFQQVFEVARALGVRYVWIDALCIIQGDDGHDGDKAKDIATMNLIYESAILTVMSAWSSARIFSSPNEDYRHQAIKLHWNGKDDPTRPFSFDAVSPTTSRGLRRKLFLSWTEHGSTRNEYSPAGLSTSQRMSLFGTASRLCSVNSFLLDTLLHTYSLTTMHLGPWQDSGTTTVQLTGTASSIPPSFGGVTCLSTQASN
ncbi:hypothetical protein B0T16DRAFT_450742 [Cercophora newfieldiana]|uniref:Heterokaryon incompatibility domain-containing protein n=1 Tax=Cercophora newfieldiana TaxID=92897 RepID=A0AA40CZJ6_9PEZI|nr:hypothetical protein B0T16DRAFT_450742 [Cercophora newfieldiana]